MPPTRNRILPLLLAIAALLSMLTACNGISTETWWTPAGSQSAGTRSFVPQTPERSYTPGESSYTQPESSDIPVQGTLDSNRSDGILGVIPTSAPSTTQGAVNTTTESDSLQNISTTVTVTIPEGYTFYQIAALLEMKGVCSAQAFYDAAQAYEVKSFTIKNDPNRAYKMEGYLFPDTYEFYRNGNPTDVLVKILNNYYQKSGLPDDKTLILASIIEHEARSLEHRKKVSAVFHNRMAINMKLDADCTINYVEKHIKPNPLVSDSGRYAALYNTYKFVGLPAGPICSPGKTSIEAARNPATDMDGYYYYFFGNDNTNHYSRTYEEHQAQMKIYGVNYGVDS